MSGWNSTSQAPAASGGRLGGCDSTATFATTATCMSGCTAVSSVRGGAHGGDAASPPFVYAAARDSGGSRADELRRRIQQQAERMRGEADEASGRPSRRECSGAWVPTAAPPPPPPRPPSPSEASVVPSADGTHDGSTDSGAGAGLGIASASASPGFGVDMPTFAPSRDGSLTRLFERGDSDFRLQLGKQPPEATEALGVDLRGKSSVRSSLYGAQADDRRFPRVMVLPPTPRHGVRPSAESAWSKLRKPKVAPDGAPAAPQAAAGVALWSEVRKRSAVRAFQTAFRRETQLQRKRDWRKLRREKGSWHVAKLALRTYLREHLSKGCRRTGSRLWRTFQTDHTIISALYPASEDLSGDKLRDENVIHIFWLMFIGELCVLCMLNGGDDDAPLLSLTTLINGVITTIVCTVVGIICKHVFRWGNRSRTRRRTKPRAVARLRQSISEMSSLSSRRGSALGRGATRRVAPDPFPGPTVDGVPAGSIDAPPVVTPSVRRFERLGGGSGGRCRVDPMASSSRPAAGSDGGSRAAKKYSLAAVGAELVGAELSEESTWRRASEESSWRLPRKASTKISRDDDWRAHVEKSVVATDLLKRDWGRRPSKWAIAQGKPLRRVWTDADGEPTERPRAHIRFRHLPRRKRRVRLVLAWAFSLVLYAMGCLAVLVYGAKFGAPELKTLIEAWIAGLVLTWLLVEPGEIFGVVFFPRLFSGVGGRCRRFAKGLGLYG